MPRLIVSYILPGNGSAAGHYPRGS